MKKLKVFSVAVSVISLMLGASPASAVKVFVKKLPITGGPVKLALDLNEAGQVVGFVFSASGAKGFATDGRNQLTIHPPGWSQSQAFRISDNGRIVGNGDDGGITKGFLFGPGGYTDLLPPGCTSASATGVNNGGQAVGRAECAGVDNAYLYDGVTYTTFIPPGGSEAEARDINAGGDVVGITKVGGLDRGFLFDGAHTEIIPPGWVSARAVRINDDGTVLGVGDDGDDDLCFLYESGSYRTIVPPGFVGSLTCTDLNANGDVIGMGFSLISGFKGFIYRAGRYHTLETGNFYVEIGALNNALQIAGAGVQDVSTSTALAVIGYILPDPDVTAGGGDGPVSLPAGAPLNLKVAMDAFFFKGKAVDWWLFAQTPSGVLSYDFAQRRWRPGFFRTASLPLIEFSPKNIPPAGSTPGAYTYYFGADLKRNGVFELKYFVFDSIFVFLR